METKKEKNILGYNKVTLRSYPKAIFLYPLFIWTIITLFFQWTDELWNNYWSNLFSVTPELLGNGLSFTWLLALFICLFVVSIEVKLSKLLAAGFVGAVIIALLFYIGINVWQWIPNPTEQELALTTPFYISISFILGFVLGCMIVGARTEYVRVERNEIWCMKGVVGKSKERFPTRSLEINVERPDFFERLLGTGRVSIKIPSLNKYIQLDTVFRAGRKVAKIDKLLGALEFIDVSKSIPQ